MMVAGDLRLPVEDASDEERVIERALELLSSYPDLELLKNCGGRARPVEGFVTLKQERQRKQLARIAKSRQIPYGDRRVNRLTLVSC